MILYFILRKRSKEKYVSVVNLACEGELSNLYDYEFSAVGGAPVDNKVVVVVVVFVHGSLSWTCPMVHFLCFVPAVGLRILIPTYLDWIVPKISCIYN